MPKVIGRMVGTTLPKPDLEIDDPRHGAYVKGKNVISNVVHAALEEAKENEFFGKSQKTIFIPYETETSYSAEYVSELITDGFSVIVIDGFDCYTPIIVQQQYIQYSLVSAQGTEDAGRFLTVSMIDHIGNTMEKLTNLYIGTRSLTIYKDGYYQCTYDGRTDIELDLPGDIHVNALIDKKLTDFDVSCNGIKSVILNADYTLTLTFDDGTSYTTPSIRGAVGATGSPGKDGSDGSNGIGIASIKQTTTSTADGGNNVFTVTLDNGQSATFTVKNGSKGGTGATGPQGPAYTLTDADRNTIVAAVIAALPDASEVSY